MVRARRPLEPEQRAHSRPTDSSKSLRACASSARCTTHCARRFPRASFPPRRPAYIVAQEQWCVAAGRACGFLPPWLQLPHPPQRSSTRAPSPLLSPLPVYGAPSLASRPRRAPGHWMPWTLASKRVFGLSAQQQFFPHSTTREGHWRPPSSRHSPVAGRQPWPFLPTSLSYLLPAPGHFARFNREPLGGLARAGVIAGALRPLCQGAAADLPLRPGRFGTAPRFMSRDEGACARRRPTGRPGRLPGRAG